MIWEILTRYKVYDKFKIETIDKNKFSYTLIEVMCINVFLH